MTYKQAVRECKRVGTNHAEGDALPAMYARLIAGAHGGAPENYYAALFCDDTMIVKARHLIRDRQSAKAHGKRLCN